MCTYIRGFKVVLDNENMNWFVYALYNQMVWFFFFFLEGNIFSFFHVFIFFFCLFKILSLIPKIWQRKQEIKKIILWQSRGLYGDYVAYIQCIPSVFRLSGYWTNDCSHRSKLFKIVNGSEYFLHSFNKFLNKNLKVTYYGVHRSHSHIRLFI